MKRLTTGGLPLYHDSTIKLTNLYSLASLCWSLFQEPLFQCSDSYTSTPFYRSLGRYNTAPLYTVQTARIREQTYRLLRYFLHSADPFGIDFEPGVARKTLKVLIARGSGCPAAGIPPYQAPWRRLLCRDSSRKDPDYS